jgi:hypothetical protein
MNKEIPEADKKETAKGILKTRRSFVKTAAQVAITAPAVSILLAANTKPAVASVFYKGAQPPKLDDGNFGNFEEDIDSIQLGSNFNPLNGANNQDDVFILPPT